MKSEHTSWSVKKRYNLIFVPIVLAVIVFIAVRTAPIDTDFTGRVRSFSQEWSTQDGGIVNIDKVKNGDFGGTAVLEKELPANLSDSDAFCFESKNAQLTVSLDGEEIYSYGVRENITGLGYGFAFHEIPLSAEDAGKTIRLCYTGAYKKHMGAMIMNVYLCPAGDYVRLNLCNRLLSTLASILILVFGVILLLLYFRFPDKTRLPFDIFSLGLGALILSIWFLADSTVMQLVSGQVHLWRVLNKVMAMFVLYPFTAFFCSLTKAKRPIFQHICFGMTVFFTTLLFVLRFAFHIDMIATYERIITVFLASYFVLIVVMVLDNLSYCRRRGLPTELGTFYIGIIALLGNGIIDLVIYMFGSRTNDSYLNFVRIGMAIFIAVMIFRFLYWWTRDQEAIGRERFINRALQYAVASNSSDENIDAMLTFLGTEFQAKRCFIFEENADGKYHGTYEWLAEGQKSGATDLLYLPREGMVEGLYHAFKDGGNRLVISDVEKIRETDPALYSLLVDNHVENIVISTLETNGKLVGFFGLVNVPQATIEEIPEMIYPVAYFFAQLIQYRDEQERLLFYSYNDSLSGARNRRAYMEFTDNRLDMEQPFGYVAADINGLKEANNTLGYEAGDRMVVDVARVLIDTFGEEHVFRMGGSEFVAFGFETDELFFNNDVSRVRKQFEDRGLSVSIGAAYCANGANRLSSVIRHTNEQVKRETELYDRR